MLNQLLLSAAVLSAAGPATPGLTSRLAEVQQLAADDGERLWPGYGSAPFGVLLLREKQEELLCHKPVPSGFSPAGSDSGTGCARFVRPRSDLPGELLAAMPLFGPPGLIVMGTPASTNRSEAEWSATILHEHFHQWQYSLPGYFERTNRLNLHGGDDTGMWVLNYAFPYSNPAVGRAFRTASDRLAAALSARESTRLNPALRKYLRARRALAARAGPRNWRYFELQLWQEGVARWTEITLAKQHPWAEVRRTAAAMEQKTLSDLTTQSLASRKRESVYAYGAAEAMLLEACGSGWRSEYPTQLALGPMLEKAGRACGTSA